MSLKRREKWFKSANGRVFGVPGSAYATPYFFIWRTWYESKMSAYALDISKF